MQQYVTIEATTIVGKSQASIGSESGVVGGRLLGAFSNGSESPAVATPATNAKRAGLNKYSIKFF
jgi:hypothetical protein